MTSAVLVVVPLKTKCSIRCDMPPRPSGSWRDPVSTHTPTATERTCGICSVRTRMPLLRTLLRRSSVISPLVSHDVDHFTARLAALVACGSSGAAHLARPSVTGWIGGVRILELLAVGQGRLFTERHLPGETHLA